MGRQQRGLRQGARWTVLALAVSVVSPMLVGCSRGSQPADSGPMPGPSGPAPRRTGLTGKQKVAILVGAAALYYLYKKHQNKQGTGAQGQYYLSKNGRVYYRDRNGQPVWVTPPRVEVPESEAQQYRDYAGYNGQNSGKAFGGYGAASGAGGGPPGPPGPPGR